MLLEKQRAREPSGQTNTSSNSEFYILLSPAILWFIQRAIHSTNTSWHCYKHPGLGTLGDTKMNKEVFDIYSPRHPLTTSTPFIAWCGLKTMRFCHLLTLFTERVSDTAPPGWQAMWGLKDKETSPGWVAPLLGVSSHTPKGGGFDPGSGHIQVRFGSGHI